MSERVYDFSVSKGTGWLDRSVARSIKEEMSKWPSWKQSAYGVSDVVSGEKRPGSKSSV